MGIDEQRREAVERLKALTLEGGSHEMLSAIARAVMPDAGAWTVGACRGLRDRLVALIGRGEQAGGMSITDGLRKEARGFGRYVYMAPQAEHLIEIADRIDAEHERLMAERRRSCVFYDAERNYCKVHDEGDMAELGYVRLPVDADGEPIHIGDVMEFSAFEVEKPVTRTVDGIGQGVFFAWCGERGYQQHEAKRYRHAPTVEDVLREFADAMSENLGMYTGEVIDADEWRDADRKTIAEYAAKLRLAGDGE